jgi:hypothetical protein
MTEQRRPFGFAGAKRCRGRVANTAHSGCTGRGGSHIHRPCTFVLADMSSADDRAPSRSRPATSIGNRPARTYSLWSSFLVTGCAASRRASGRRSLVRLTSCGGADDRHDRCLHEGPCHKTRRESPNAVLQPDRRHQQLTGRNDRMVVKSGPVRIRVHLAIVGPHARAPSLTTDYVFSQPHIRTRVTRQRDDVVDGAVVLTGAASRSAPADANEGSSRGDLRHRESRATRTADSDEDG